MDSQPRYKGHTIRYPGGHGSLGRVKVGFFNAKDTSFFLLLLSWVGQLFFYSSVGHIFFCQVGEVLQLLHVAVACTYGMQILYNQIVFVLEGKYGKLLSPRHY